MRCLLEAVAFIHGHGIMHRQEHNLQRPWLLPYTIILCWVLMVISSVLEALDVSGAVSRCEFHGFEPGISSLRTSCWPEPQSEVDERPEASRVSNTELKISDFGLARMSKDRRPMKDIRNHSYSTDDAMKSLAKQCSEVVS